MVQLISDSDRDWLKALQKDLWPEEKPLPLLISLEAIRILTEEEYERLTRILDEKNLVVGMICTSMFGGYGVKLYEHEVYPHTGAQHLLSLTEDHLPPERTRFERDFSSEKATVSDRPGGGRGSNRAWLYFSRYTHTPEMMSYCKRYGLQIPFPRSYYDY